LRDAFLQLRSLPQPLRPPQIEMFLLAGEQRRHLRVAGARGQEVRKIELSLLFPLGIKPRFPRRQFIQPFGDDGEIRACYRVIQSDQQIAALDACAIAHIELADNAAGRMLNFFHIAVDDKLAACNHRAGELQHRGAAADAADQHHHGHKSDQHIAANRTTGSERRLICHDDVLSLSDTTFICAGIGEVGRILRNTSSFGPTICTLPSRITST
jgi:hypothetical protein